MTHDQALASILAIAVIDKHAELARNAVTGKLQLDAEGDCMFLTRIRHPRAFKGDFPGAICISAEEGDRMAHYYGQWEGECGPLDPWVCPEIESWAKVNKYVIEWRDPGTVLLFPEWKD